MKAFEVRIPDNTRTVDILALTKEQYPGLIDEVAMARLTVRYSSEGLAQQVQFDFHTPPWGGLYLIPKGVEFTITSNDRYDLIKVPLSPVVTVEIADRGEPL